VYLAVVNGVGKQEKFGLSTFNQGSQACHRDSHSRDRRNYSSPWINTDAVVIGSRKQR